MCLMHEDQYRVPSSVFKIGLFLPSDMTHTYAFLSTTLGTKTAERNHHVCAMNNAENMLHATVLLEVG